MRDQKVAKWLNAVADTKLSRLKRKLSNIESDQDMLNKRYTAITMSIAISLKSLTKQKRREFINAIVTMNPMELGRLSKHTSVMWAELAPGYNPYNQRVFEDHLGYVFMQGYGGLPRYPDVSEKMEKYADAP